MPSMYGARPSAQSRAKAWTVNTPTRPCPSRSKVILCPLWVRGGQKEQPWKPLKRAKILFTDIWNHRRGDTHVMGDTWWRTHKSTRMNLKAARQQMCEGLRNFGMCIWTELSILTVCTPKATEQNKPCKVFTMQRHCFDSTGRRPGWK